MRNNIRSIEDIAKYLKSIGEKLEPLSADKVKELEERIEHALPAVYKKFLLLMGKGAGGYMKGSSAFYPEIFNLQVESADLILENSLAPLPENAFVFWMHQGYQAAYFVLGENPDPPIYFFAEGSLPKEFHVKEKSLSDFFLALFIVDGYAGNE